MTKYELAYLDGNFSNIENVDILQIHALHYASSVFEGIRVYSGRAFMLDAHVDRLLRSAEIIGLNPGFDRNHCRSVLEKTIALSRLGDAYLRPVIFQGGPDLGVHAPNNTTHFGVLIWDWPAVFGDASAQQGISLTSRVPYRRPPEVSFPSQAKSSAGYLIGGINRRHAVKAGFDDALMLTHDGLVAEATGANIFAIRNGKVITPRPNGFLNGITRQVVIANLPGDLDFEECDLEFGTLLAAEEIFLAGTAYEIMPVRQVDDVIFAPGPQTQRIAAIYRSLTIPTPVFSGN